MKQQINVSEVPSVIQSILFENEKLREENRDYRAKTINYDKFYAIPWTTKTVAELHNHHEATVRKYVKLKLIPTHPKTIINWAYKALPKTGISDSVLKVLEADSGYDNEAHEDWKTTQEQQKQGAPDRFDDDASFVQYEEVK